MATSIANLSVILSANSAAFTAGLKTAEKQLAALRANVDSAASGMAAAFVGIGSALGVGLGVKWGVEVANQAEQSRIAFEVLLGSAEKAESLFNQLRDTAAKTPFSQQSITKAAQALLTYGAAAEDVTTMLKVLGDAASASPEGMAAGLSSLVRSLGQIHAKGKLQAEEINQIAERGIPVWNLLADAAGVSVSTMQDRVSKGLVDSATGIQAILQGVSAKFNNMMARQADTLSGKWSTLKDNAGTALGEVAAKTMDALNVKGGMTDLANTLANVAKNADAVAASISGIVKPALDVGGVVKDFAAFLGGEVLETARAKLAGVWDTSAPRTWAEATQNVIFNVLGTVGTATDAITMLFKSVEVGWARVKAGMGTDLAGLADPTAAFFGVDMPGLVRKSMGVKNPAQQAMEEWQKQQAEFNELVKKVGQGRGPLGQAVLEMEARFTQSQAIKAATAEAEKLNAIWQQTATTLFGWVDPGMKRLDQLAMTMRKLTDVANGFANAGAVGLAGFLHEADAVRKSLEPIASQIMGELDRADRFDTPAAMLKGSDAAYSTLVQRQVGRDTPEQRLEAVTERVLKSNEKQERLLARVLDELKSRGVLAVENLND